MFDGTRVQVTGPTGPMTVVMALVAVHFGDNLSAAFAVVIVAGLFQVVTGLLGLGRFVKLAPQPVVSGFMSGIGLIIIIVQFAPMPGRAGPDGAILVKLSDLPGTANLAALRVSLGVLAILVFIPAWLGRILPPPLLALVAGAAAVEAFGPNVPLIGDVPGGFPEFMLPGIEVSEIPDILRFALILAFLGSIDSLLTSLVADSITRSRHDSNRDRFGQGIGNVVAGFFGGIPGAVATMRTLVNVRCGGNSRLSGAIHAILLLLVVLGFGSFASQVLLAVLAGILLKVGFDIVDWGSLKKVFSSPRADVIVMLSTLMLTVFVDLITAVAFGFVLASVLFVARVAEAQTRNARFAFGADEVEDISAEEQAILDSCAGRLVLFHIEGPLSFGSARDMSRIMTTEIDKDILAIDMGSVPIIDGSATAALDEVTLRLRDDDDILMLYGVREGVRHTLQRTGTLDRVGQERVFDRRIDALVAARSTIAAKLEQVAGD